MEHQQSEHGHLFQRTSERKVRWLHELTLVIAGLVWLDWSTADLLGRLADSITRRHSLDDILLLSIPLFATTLSVLFGIILIYRHRCDLFLLPIRSYISYIVAAGAWAVLAMATVDECFSLGRTWWHWRYTFLSMWCLFILAFLIPWAVFRRRQPTPLIIDAVLTPIAAILGYHALGYLSTSSVRRYSQSFQYFDVFRVTEKTLFLNGLILLCFILLVLFRRRVRRFWIYVVVCLIAWACLFLPPSVQ